MKNITLQELYDAIVRYKDNFDKNPEYRKIVEKFKQLAEQKNCSNEEKMKLLKEYFWFEAKNEHGTVVPKRKLIAGRLSILTWVVFFLSVLLLTKSKLGLYMLGVIFVYFLFILAECFQVKNYYSLPRETAKYLSPKWFYTIFNIIGAVLTAIISTISFFKEDSPMTTLFILFMGILMSIIYYFDRDVRHDALANLSNLSNKK